MVNWKQRLYERILKQILKQAEEGVPVEGQGFIVRPSTATMPTIDHRHAQKRPEFVEKDLEGWELLQ